MIKKPVMTSVAQSLCRIFLIHINLTAVLKENRHKAFQYLQTYIYSRTSLIRSARDFRFTSSYAVIRVNCV